MAGRYNKFTIFLGVLALIIIGFLYSRIWYKEVSTHRRSPYHTSFEQYFMLIFVSFMALRQLSPGRSIYPDLSQIQWLTWLVLSVLLVGLSWRSERRGLRVKTEIWKQGGETPEVWKSTNVSPEQHKKDITVRTTLMTSYLILSIVGVLALGWL